jgi:putative inorganic carbon (HCO3(-)) transporter
MIEWLISVLIIAPAFALTLRGSSRLLDYAVIVLAFNRCIRRIVDYYFNGGFNPFSPISLTPLVVACLLIFSLKSVFSRLSPRARIPFRLIAAAITIGFAVGLVLNKAAAIYSLGEWLAGLGTMAFAATRGGEKGVADRWIKTTGWCAVIVAIYAWWQYYTIPPWDGAWLVQSGMAGYMGQPEPTKMTVFSTLNERGPCGGFLAWAAIPMILNSRWRNAGGWLSVALLLSAIVLTGTRTNLIIIGVVVLLYPALTRGRGIFGLLVLTALFVSGATWGLQHIPGMDKMSDRFGAQALYGKNSSFQGRLAIYSFGAGTLITKPLGLGLGSSGMGFRVAGETSMGLGDCGYIQIIGEFGWLGSILFFAALWRVWKELGARWKIGCLLTGQSGVDPFVPATRAILLGSLVLLFVGDIFSGFSLLWVFFGRALSQRADPLFTYRLKRLLNRRARSRRAGSTGALVPA